MARVTIRDLGIRFSLAHRRDRSVKNILLHPLRSRAREEFWAIRHVNLDLANGDILGIIGPNGAGKSTLLRSITGIYQPDEGTIEIEGRVSLLAIGAGFNLELSGIENIYLNGAVIGFAQREIEALIPRIRDFADIGEFLHQPIRTYSSGMVSRLGFAIAINLDPDILLIDEVMAVGDRAFSEKCQVAIRDLLGARERIVVIVSHQQELIDTLCTRQFRLERKAQ